MVVNKKKFFGTDGIRGKVGDVDGHITPKMMAKLGWAVGRVIQTEQKNKPGQAISAMIGKDTRISGYMLESALESGLIASGVNVYLVGPMPTPAIAYLTKTFSCDVGIAITASHNPFSDNGIKFFASNGEKMATEIETKIESLLSQPSNTNPAHLLGKAFRINDSAGRYIEFCKSSFPMHLNLEGIKLAIDCANGATYHIAPEVFKELGAEVIASHIEPDGLNINHQCGSNHPSKLIELVQKNKADLGIAFDGDGDRICLVDHQGQLVNGDGILYILAKYLQSNNQLNTNQIVGTEMTNLGLEKALEKIGLELIRTEVGDRYIREQMKTLNANLGGESSGHIVFTDYINTGDAIISALQVLKIIKETGQSIKGLLNGLILYPNLLENIPIANGVHQNINALLSSASYQKVINDANEKLLNLESEGRILVRASGTEALLRIMVEASSVSNCQQIINFLSKEIKNLIKNFDASKLS